MVRREERKIYLQRIFKTHLNSNGDGEVFTLPHIFCAESEQSVDCPRTKLRLLLAGTPAKLESPSPNSVQG